MSYADFEVRMWSIFLAKGLLITICNWSGKNICNMILLISLRVCKGVSKIELERNFKEKNTIILIVKDKLFYQIKFTFRCSIDNKYDTRECLLDWQKYFGDKESTSRALTAQRSRRSVFGKAIRKGFFYFMIRIS